MKTNIEIKIDAREDGRYITLSQGNVDWFLAKKPLVAITFWEPIENGSGFQGKGFNLSISELKKALALIEASLD